MTGHGQVKKEHPRFQFIVKPKVQNVWLAEQEHLRQFLDAADWFVENQDKKGGWPSQVGK